MEPDPQQPREKIVHRAEQAAEHAEQHLPSWLRPGDPESRWPVLLALIAAIVVQRMIPERYTLVPRWPLISLEIALVLVLLVINPVRLTRSTVTGKYVSWVLLAAIAVDNTLSAFKLDREIVTGGISNNPAVLLGSGAGIFVTNIIVFGIWFWELDRGGPFARRAGENPYPDFMFPQMSGVPSQVARPDWRPTFVDYLYVSITNVMAFSPTDTMPLSRRAKLLMTVQAVVAVSTLVLVVARAVNVLP
ncbi:MAG TPA: hypothetical protein VIJ23_00140 [Mycobacterium sp.]